MQKKIYALKILVLQWNTIVGKSKHLKVWCSQYHTSGETECQNFNLNELHCLRHICTISNHIQQWVMLTLMMMTMIYSCAQKRGGPAQPQAPSALFQAPVPAQLSGTKHHTSSHLCTQGIICKLILQYVQKLSQMNSQNLEDAYVSAVLASLRKIKSTLHCKLSTIRICVMCQCFKTAILPSLSRV